jgi:hypothetical protein
MRLHFNIAAAVLALGLCFSPASAQAPGTALDKDLALFLDWFPGRYDNELQVFWERDENVAEDARHERIHSIFRPVDLPAFGKHVFYVEQFSDGDPSKIYRQRIYAFSADEGEEAIRLRIYTPKNPGVIAGAWRDPAKLTTLKLKDATTLPGCDVFWRRQANQFLGSIPDGGCKVRSERLGEEIVIDDDLVLTPDEIWIADRATTIGGAYVFGNRAGVPHKLKKVRPFECWTATLKGARHGDSGEGLNDWNFSRGGLLHDQGGELKLQTADDPPRQLRLKLRRVEWPSGPNRPSLTLYVHESDNPRAVSYVWGEADADRLGLNLRWLQASCTLAPERLWE